MFLKLFNLINLSCHIPPGILSTFVGSIPTVAGHIFQARPMWIYTQSNITNIILYNSYISLLYWKVLTRLGNYILKV